MSVCHGRVRARFAHGSTRALCACGLAVLGAMAALAGCASDPRDGYAFGGAFDSSIRTVSVPMFRNSTFSPGLEQQLTEAIIKEVQARTGMRVVQDASRADSVLTGVITSVEKRRISLDNTTGLVQELAIEIVIDFDWKEARSGRTLVARRVFSSADTFVPTRPSGERLELGQLSAVQRLARDVVGQMRSSW